MKKTVESNSVSLEKSDFYTKLDYSPLGITIWAERTVDEYSPEEPCQPNITFRYKNGKEELLENISMQANTFGSDHYSCKAIHDDTFEGFRWIYGFSNRCDWRSNRRHRNRRRLVLTLKLDYLSRSNKISIRVPSPTSLSTVIFALCKIAPCFTMKVRPGSAILL